MFKIDICILVASIEGEVSHSTFLCLVLVFLFYNM